MRAIAATSAALLALSLLATSVSAKSPSTTYTPFTVDDTYLFSDVSLFPCTFPVRVHEVTKGGIIVFANASSKDVILQATSSYTLTNLDTGKSIDAFSATTVTTYDDFVVTENSDGSVTLSYSDNLAGLNFLVKSGGTTTVLAGLSTTHYTFTYSSSGMLLSFSVDSDNTPQQEHASATVCRLLAP